VGSQGATGAQGTTGAQGSQGAVGPAAVGSVQLRSGEESVAFGSSVAITFSQPMPNTNYSVTVTANQSAFTYWLNKTVNGFDLYVVKSGPGSSGSVSADWQAVGYQ
jgi:hypothetical protein